MSEKRTILQNRTKKTRIPFSKDVLVFLFCILLSTIFWFLYTFSNSKEAILDIPIKYVNLPINYITSDSLSSEVRVKVKNSGFSLFLYQFKRNKDAIIIDLNKCSQKAS